MSEDPAVLIVAGPGSGKTRVMAARLAHLLMNGTLPEDIMLISFTQQDAENMRIQAEAVLKKAKKEGATTRNVACFTFHKFCSDVLKQYAHLIPGSRNKIIIADDGDLQKIMIELMEQKNMKSSSSVANRVLQKIRYWKELGLGYVGVRKKSLIDWTDQTAYDLYPEYQGRLMAKGALDLGDLLLQTIRIFRQEPQVLEQVRRRYQHILVDEVQDMSPAQYDILRLLSLGSAGPGASGASGGSSGGSSGGGRSVGAPGGPVVVSDDQYEQVEEGGYRSEVVAPVPMVTSELTSAQILANRRNRVLGSSTGANGGDGEEEGRQYNLRSSSVSSPSTRDFVMSNGGITSTEPSPPAAPTAEKRRVVNVFCAGDDDQSIYAWRGAKVELMRRFQYDFPGAKVVKFCVSYRLPDALCKAATALIESVPSRIPKSLHAAYSPAMAGYVPASRDSSASDTLLPLGFLPTLATETPPPAAFRGVQAQAQDVDLTATRAAIEIRSLATDEDEMDWIVRYIQHKKSHAEVGQHSGRSKVDMVVLARSWDMLNKVVARLQEGEIETLSRNFVPRVLSSDANAPLNLLRLLSSQMPLQDDDLAFEAAMDNDILLELCSMSEIQEVILATIRRRAAAEGCSMMTAARRCILRDDEFKLQGKYLKATQRFFSKFDTTLKEFDRYWGSDQRKRFQLIFNSLNDFNQQRWCAALENDVDELSKAAAKFHKLSEFFESMGLEGNLVLEAETNGRTLPVVVMDDEKKERGDEGPPGRGVPGSGRGRGGVQVNVWAMLMHTAKGLEFDEVFLPFWNDGVVPPTARGLPPTLEERKLAFVSVTRARERVMISFARQKAVPRSSSPYSPYHYQTPPRYDTVPMKPSPLVQELLRLEEPPISFEHVESTGAPVESLSPVGRGGADAGARAGAQSSGRGRPGGSIPPLRSVPFPPMGVLGTVGSGGSFGGGGGGWGAPVGSRSRSVSGSGSVGTAPRQMTHPHLDKNILSGWGPGKLVTATATAATTAVTATAATGGAVATGVLATGAVAGAASTVVTSPPVDHITGGSAAAAVPVPVAVPIATIYDEQGKTHENRYSNPEQLSKDLLDLLFPAETAHNTEVTGVVRVPTVHDEAKPVASDSESTDSKKERKKRAPMSEEAKEAMKAKCAATIAAKKAAPAPEAAPAEAAPAEAAPAPEAAPASDGEEKDKKARKPRGPMSAEAKAAMKAKREATIAAKKAVV